MTKMIYLITRKQKNKHSSNGRQTVKDECLHTGSVL